MSQAELEGYYLSCFSSNFLLLLTDARDTETVAALLPKSKSLVVVTSVVDLGLGVEFGAAVVKLSSLSREDSVRLLWCARARVCVCVLE